MSASLFVESDVAIIFSGEVVHFLLYWEQELISMHSIEVGGL
jgi:hypothetical protein